MDQHTSIMFPDQITQGLIRMRNWQKPAKILSLFFLLLWRDMTKSSGLNAGEWDVVLSQIMGKAWAEAGGIGLAKVLYKQLSKSSSENDLGDDNSGEFLPAEESQ